MIFQFSFLAYHLITVQFVMTLNHMCEFLFCLFLCFTSDGEGGWYMYEGIYRGRWNESVGDS